MGALVALVLLAVAQGVFFARRVLRPLRSLEEATQTVERGDLSAQTNWRLRDDELGDLARRFGTMTDALRQRTEQLQATNASLDREAALRRASELRMRTITDNLPALISHLATKCVARASRSVKESTWTQARNGPPGASKRPSSSIGAGPDGSR